MWNGRKSGKNMTIEREVDVTKKPGGLKKVC